MLRTCCEISRETSNPLRTGPDPPVDWKVAHGFTDYQTAVHRMEDRVGEIACGAAGELVWLVEHPALYTAGTSARHEDLLRPDRFPVYKTGRGGQYTYHGPGQRVVYVMLDLRKRGRDVRAFVRLLEQWIIDTLAGFDIVAERREDRVGVWVGRPELAMGREAKIAAIGIRLRRWISYHGLAINLKPDLEHFSGIVPCGVKRYGVTSIADLGVTATLADLDRALKNTFRQLFASGE
ncbi:MAG: lipoyl(octanoyl) transferase LipB [Hyphomicrobiales bacterium]